jgi:hypothetical protein
MEELKNIAPHLSKLPKKDAYTTPDGYFDDLPSMVQDRIVAESNTNKSRILFPRWTLATMGIATMVCIVFFWSQSIDNSKITKEEATAYINETMEQEFDENLLAEELASIDSELTTSEENLEEYILNQDIDEQLLREEI